MGFLYIFIVVELYIVYTLESSLMKNHTIIILICFQCSV